MFLVTRDGCMQSVHETENEAYAALHRHQGQSADHAVKYEGWKIEPAPQGEYITPALRFLLDTGTQMRVTFEKNGHHFGDDQKQENKRDIYRVTFTRGTRSFSLEFGQSLVHSGRYIAYGDARRGALWSHKEYMRERFVESGKWAKNKDFETPSAYDVLACIEKSDPGTFADFCSEFGYDEDSRKAETVYKAVKEQWQNVERLWSDKEIERLEDIQ